MLENSLLFLDGEKQVSLSDFFQETSPESPYWLHFSPHHSEACSWMKEHSGVDSALLEPMLFRKVRPRILFGDNCFLLILRVAESGDFDERDELRSLRMYVDAHRVISTSFFPLFLVEKLAKKWKKIREGGSDIKAFFMDLIQSSMEGIDQILEDLEERVDELDRHFLEKESTPEGQEIANLSIDSLHLRRCLAPQKEVFAKMKETELTWLIGGKKVREFYERASRQLDEVESIRDRARILREQRGSLMAEQMNEHLYVFSLVALIFLPLGFLTGLLGVNLGGIPGGDSSWGFAYFCLLLSVLVGLMLFISRRFKWL